MNGQGGMRRGLSPEAGRLSTGPARGCRVLVRRKAVVRRGWGLDRGSEPHPVGWGRSSRGLIQVRRVSL